MDERGAIAKRYATCRSYSDRGMTFLRGEVHGRFRTRFVRDGEVLDFVYDGVDGAHYELASRGGSCTMQLPPSLAAIEFGFPVDTPALCIAGLTGVTVASAFHVPRLLMPDRIEGPSVAADGSLAPTLIARDAWSLAYALPTYSGDTTSVAIVDARHLELRAIGDQVSADDLEGVARDWTRFDWVVLYDHIELEQPNRQS